MQNSNWEKPVAVAIPGVGLQNVESPFEALALLTEGWPTMAGRHFIRARLTCKAALANRATLEQARREFENAAQEETVF